MQLGLIGLIEEEWLATLATLALEDVTYLDFVSEGRKLAKLLREKVRNVCSILSFITPFHVIS